MTIEQQKDEAYYLIDKLELEQVVFWESLRNIVELAGDQFVGKRLSFAEVEEVIAEKGGALILSVVLNFGFAVFPIHSMAAGMLIKGISRSKTIQKLIDKNVVNKLMKLPKEQLEKFNDRDLVEFENETLKNLNNEIGNGLKLFIKDEVKTRLTTKKNRKNSNGSDQNQGIQNEGLVIVKKGLYKWILAHRASDIKQLIDLKNAVRSDEWDEDSLDGVINNLEILLEESTKSPTRDVNPDDFQLLIEAALWSATYDFWPGFRKRNRTTLYRDPIKLPKNDDFWKYLINQFINNGFMARVYYGEAAQHLRKKGKYNSTKFNENVRNTDLKKMRNKYSIAPQTQIGGNSGDERYMEVYFNPKDEDKLLLTYYFDKLSTELDRMQEKIVRKIET